MQITVLALLAAVALGFGFLAAIGKDRSLLIASGTTMLLLSGFVLTSGIEYQDGYTEVREQVDNTTTDITRSPTYTDLSTDSGYQDANIWFALIGVGTSLYLLFQGVLPQKTRKTSLEKLLS